MEVKEGRAWKGKESLAMSRAFGDWLFKTEGGGGVSVEKTVTKIPEDWTWIIVACDGLWDVVKAEDCTAMMEGDPVEIADKLTREAIWRGECMCGVYVWSVCVECICGAHILRRLF